MCKDFSRNFMNGATDSIVLHSRDKLGSLKAVDTNAALSRSFLVATSSWYSEKPWIRGSTVLIKSQESRVEGRYFRERELLQSSL